MGNTRFKFRAWNGSRYLHDWVNVDLHPGVNESCVKVPDTYSYSSANVAALCVEQAMGRKDSNNVDVYEGDIVELLARSEITFDKEFHRAVVVWDEQDCGFVYVTNSNTTPVVRPWLTLKVTVIGNINETPHLLQRKNV